MGYWSAIAGIGSAAIGALAGTDEQSTAIDMARENRQWQEDMSNSAYQRQVRDMRAAGLNPILAANGGGASSPGGSTAPAVDRLSRGVSSARDSARLVAEIKNIHEDTQVKKSVEAVNEMQAQNLKVDNEVKRASAKLVEAQVPGAKTEEKIDETWWGKFMRYAGRLSGGAGSASSVANAIGQVAKLVK